MARREDLPVPLGSILNAKYRVDRVIGEGGMGIVYAGTHLALERPVAVKVMRPSLSEDADAVARFDREARAAAVLQSAHVARVLDVGRSPDGDPYIVMEHLVGMTLQALAEKGRLAPAHMSRIALDIVDALAEAHAAGIIHRDLKPANVFLVGESAKVLDFGIAKVDRSLGGEAITTTGSVLGTPAFMAPEQLDTKRGVTTKTDVWALGVTMYYALTTTTPFEAESFYDLSVKVYAHEPTPITNHRADLPPELVAVITGCLQKDAKKRLTLEAVAAKLSSISERLAPHHTDLGLTGEAATYERPSEDALTIRQWSPLEAEPMPMVPEEASPAINAVPTSTEPPRKSPALLLAAAVLLALALVIVFARRGTTTNGAPIAAPAIELAPAESPAVVAATPRDQQRAVGGDDTPLPTTSMKSVPPAHSTHGKRRVAPAAPKDSGALTHER